MRSTPILLDRLRHIKYDLQAGWDMEYLLVGGLSSLLEKEVNFELCQSLLWFGLKSEDPHLTMEDTKKLMEGAGINPKDEKKIIAVFATCAKELFDSGWLYIPEKNPEGETTPKEETKPQSTREHILELVTLAQAVGLVDSEKIWKHTPSDIERLYETVMMVRFPKKQEPKQQTPEEMLALIRASAASMGGS